MSQTFSRPPIGKSKLGHAVLISLSQLWSYILMGSVILLADYFTGPFLMFPIFFVIPVTLAAWFRGARTAYFLAVLLPIGRAYIAGLVEHHFPLVYVTANAAVRIGVLSFIAYLVSRTALQTKELEKEVKMLEGILHICMFCKRIRSGEQSWEPLEGYISHRTDADFSHGLCPECAQKHYGHVLTGARDIGTR
jgi:hypothetical protein